MQISYKIISDYNNWSLGLLRGYKILSEMLSFKKNITPGKVLMILGCQRSGTSLIYWIFERDLNTKIYREKSKLTSHDPEKLRLNSYQFIQKEIYKHNANLIIMKPLVESQNAITLLNSIRNSKVLWMYRNYNDVISSNLKAFGVGNGIKDLLPIIKNQITNWRCENISDETKSIISKYFSETMNPFDAAALFWLVRNRLFFENKLYENEKIMLFKYEDLVSNPEKSMRRIYKFVDCKFPGNKIIKSVHSKSIGKGTNVKLTSGIKQLCEVLLYKMDSIYSAL